MSDVPFANRVRITDVSPRDGLQNEPGVIATADKARLVDLLCRAGVDEVEVTSFVSAKWVPQLGDAAELLKLLPPSPREGAGGRVQNPSPEGRGRGGVQNPSPEGRGRGGVPTLRNANSANVSYQSPPRDPRAAARAKELRANETGPEAALWSQLRQDEKIGTHFRRQHPFGPFILDFFSHECAMAIEVDGLTHAGLAPKQQDAARQKFIESHGVVVYRVSNDDVVKNLEGVFRFIQQRVRERLASAPSPLDRNPTPAPPLGGGVQEAPLFSVLVPNDKGMAAALASIDAGAVIDKVSVFTAASETFNRKNTNASIAESIDRFAPVIEQAAARDLLVRGYISCVIACPFDGPIAPAKVAEVARLLVNIGVDEIDLGDTIGAATPESTLAMLDAVLAEIGEGWLDPETFTLHLHDTFGRAASCARAALDRGVRSFDGSVAGLGGCPYASTPGKRAPGNISTETLIRTIREAGLHPGLSGEINDAALAEAAAFARSLVLPKV